jgi:folate-binding protein YgfZ
MDLHLLRRDLSELRAALQAAGAVTGDRAGLEASRVAAGLARAAVDAGPGVLPQEAGLDEALSTRKGCYLGQEIMARIEARGRLKRSLTILALGDRDGDGPPADARAVLADGRRVGRLGTVALHPEAGLLALAVLRGDLEGDAPLRAAGRVARVVPATSGDAR